MRANLDARRAEVPVEAADEWLSPSLAQAAAQLARAQADVPEDGLAALVRQTAANTMKVIA